MLKLPAKLASSGSCCSRDSFIFALISLASPTLCLASARGLFLSLRSWSCFAEIACSSWANFKELIKDFFKSSELNTEENSLISKPPFFRISAKLAGVALLKSCFKRSEPPLFIASSKKAASCPGASAPEIFPLDLKAEADSFRLSILCCSFWFSSSRSILPVNDSWPANLDISSGFLIVIFFIMSSLLLTSLVISLGSAFGSL